MTENQTIPAVNAGETRPLTPEIIKECLYPLQDPEIGASLVGLGLIYDIRLLPEGKVEIDMTLTSPACPFGPEIRANVHGTAAKIPGVKEVYVNLIFNPPWNPKEMADEDTKMLLGIF